MDHQIIAEQMNWCKSHTHRREWSWLKRRSRCKWKMSFGSIDRSFVRTIKRSNDSESENQFMQMKWNKNPIQLQLNRLFPAAHKPLSYVILCIMDSDWDTRPLINFHELFLLLLSSLVCIQSAGNLLQINALISFNVWQRMAAINKVRTDADRLSTQQSRCGWPRNVCNENVELNRMTRVAPILE